MPAEGRPWPSGNNGDDGGHELEREENVMFVLNWIEGQGRFKAEILLK